MQFLHNLIGLCILVCFFSGWYRFSLSIFIASFRSSFKADLVVMNFLSICLYEKDFISPSLMKHNLAGYDILGWKLAPTLFLLVTFLLRDQLLVWWESLYKWPGLSFWLPLVFSPSLQPWWIWRFCALGLLFLWSIFVVFSVFSGFECWPALLGLRDIFLDNILRSIFQLEFVLFIPFLYAYQT